MNTNVKDLLKRFGWFGVICCAALILSVPSLWRRVSWERSVRSAAIVVDGSHLDGLAGTPDRFQKVVDLLSAGASGIMASEATGEELAQGAVEGVSLLSLMSAPEPVAAAWAHNSGTVIRLKAPCDVTESLNYMKRRFPSGLGVVAGQESYFVLPFQPSAVQTLGVLPDLSMLNWLNNQGVPVIYRPAQGGESSSSLVESTSFLLGLYKNIRVLAPAGDVAAGYPSVNWGKIVRQYGILVAQIEFSTQVGETLGVNSAWPNVVSLHSVTDEEVLTRGIDRQTMLERMVRAAVERSVRLLVLRPDPLKGLNQSVDDYAADIRRLGQMLTRAGIGRGWPEGFPLFGKMIWSALGLGLLSVALVLRHGMRWVDVQWVPTPLNLAKTAAAGVLLGAVFYFVPITARLAGGLVTGLLAAEASLTAMELWRAPLRGVLVALAMVLVGGLVVASFFSTSAYTSRLVTFSGVKLTLLLPLALVLLLDLQSREHPESLQEVLNRPPLWGEILLGVVVLAAMAVVVVRSDNTTFVPGFERTARQWLESVLVARPRSKELLVGYPALVFWYFLKRNGLWGHYREILRLAVTLAFSSAVNSFCHFHTPLFMTVLRDLNGWWLGLLLGAVLLAAAFWGVTWGRRLLERGRGA